MINEAKEMNLKDRKAHILVDPTSLGRKGTWQEQPFCGVRREFVSQLFCCIFLCSHGLKANMDASAYSPGEELQFPSWVTHRPERTTYCASWTPYRPCPELSLLLLDPGSLRFGPLLAPSGDDNNGVYFILFLI